MTRRLFVVTFCGACLLAAFVAASVALVYARQSVDRGIRDLDSAQAFLAPSIVKRSPTTSLLRAQSDVRAAQVQFSGAHTRIELLRPVLEHLSWVPHFGQDLAAAPSLSGTAVHLADGLEPLLAGLRPLAQEVEARSSTRQNIMTRLTARIRLSAPSFQTACNQFEGAKSERAQVPKSLSGPASRAVRRLDARLPNLLKLCRGLLLAPRILGDPTPASYLVAYQDSQELRASGGFLGSAGVVRVRNGLVTQAFQGAEAPHENVSIPAPEPMVYYNYEFAWLFRDSNWAADFPTTAALERYFLSLDFHEHVNNVIDLTPDGAAAFLRGTGPLYLPEYGRWVNAGNVGTLADYYAHWTKTPGPYQLANPEVQRKQFILIVSSHILHRLDRLSAVQIVNLAESLGTSISRRGVQFQFRDPQLEAFAQSLGASGEVSPDRNDYLYLVDSNIAYNHVSPYVHIGLSYQATVRRDRWLDVHLKIHMKDGPVPPRVLTQYKSYGPGAGLLGKNTDYADFVRIFAPAGAQLVDQAGWTQPWTPGTVYRKTMFCGYVIVPYLQSRTIDLHYIVPPNVFTKTNGTSYRLLIQRQPGSHLDWIRVGVRDAAGGPVRSWNVPHPLTDSRFSAPVRALPFSPIPLAQTALRPAVKPGSLIEPHAFLARPKP
jgi:Protein of unknown function (DUF4012)